MKQPNQSNGDFHFTRAHSTNLARRQLFRVALGAALTSLGSCAAHKQSSLRCPATLADFEREDNLGPLPVYRSRHGSGPSIVLLHELPGLSPEDLALAERLAREGFTVHLPLLFGEAGQDRFFVGYFQSCARSEFECSAASTTSPIVGKIREVCRSVGERARSPIGVIGMCLTGAFPLALLGDGVEAAVLCQPTLPFTALLMRPIGEQKRAVGLAQADIDRAQKTAVPFLAMRYRTDPLCPPERFQTLQQTFGGRIALIEIDGEPQGHSTLAGDLNFEAFADAVNYLKVRLGAVNRPQRMKLAKLDGQPCEIGMNGQWRRL